MRHDFGMTLRKRAFALEEGGACEKFRGNRVANPAFGAVKGVGTLNLDDGLNTHQRGTDKKQRVFELHAGQMRLESSSLNHSRVIDCHGEAVVGDEVAVPRGVFFF